MDLAILADNRGKIKESEKGDKYLDLVRELKKLWDMRAKVIPVGIGVLWMIPKGLLSPRLQ